MLYLFVAYQGSGVEALTFESEADAILAFGGWAVSCSSAAAALFVKADDTSTCEMIASVGDRELDVRGVRRFFTFEQSSDAERLLRERGVECSPYFGDDLVDYSDLAEADEEVST